MRACSVCGETKPDEAFYARQSACRGCAKARARDRYNERREEIRARQNAVRAANPEAHREQARRWYRENRARHYATMRTWRLSNRDRKIEMEQNRRARAGGYWVEDVERLIVLARYDGKCGICGEPVDPQRFDVDHVVPVSRGGLHSYENTQPAHPPCNQGKRNRLMHEYRVLKQRVGEETRREGRAPEEAAAPALSPAP